MAKAGSETERLYFTQAVLFERNLVMSESRLGSWWQQKTGQALAGSEKGKQLTHLPYQVVSWDVWRSQHPDTDVVVVK